jgi:hypothetical protein
LSPGATVANTAEIYFDFNPAVITNTTLNTLYSCDGMLNTMTANDLDCQGDTIYGNIPVLPTDLNANWTIESTTVSTNDEFQWTSDSAGFFDLALMVSNDYCQADTVISVQVLDEYLSMTNVSMCEGDSVLVFGDYILTQGIYYDSLNTLAGCDSISVVALSVISDSIADIGLSSDTTCLNWTAIALSGSPVGGYFSGPGILSDEFNPGLAGSGEHLIYYTSDSIGCIVQDSILIWVESCLGIFENSDLSVNVFPNPTRNQFTIQFSNVPVSLFNLSISDLAGRVIYVQDIFNNEETIINTELWESGVYVIVVAMPDSNEVVYRTLLTKQ